MFCRFEDEKTVQMENNKKRIGGEEIKTSNNISTLIPKKESK